MASSHTSANELRDTALLLAPELGVTRTWYVRVLEEDSGRASSRSRCTRARVLGAPARDRARRSPGHLALARRPALAGGSRIDAARKPLGPRRTGQTMALPWVGRSALRPPARPLGVLDPRRGVSYSRRSSRRLRASRCRPCPSRITDRLPARSSSTARPATAGVKPIIGCEVYVADDRRTRRRRATRTSRFSPSRTRVTRT